MILRCQNYLCRKEFDSEYNKLIYDKDKGRGYVCPHCYKWVRVGRFRDNPVPRMRPHGSKKDRIRQRKDLRIKAMEKMEKQLPTEGKE